MKLLCLSKTIFSLKKNQTLRQWPKHGEEALANTLRILRGFGNTVESHNSGQVGCLEVVPYCGVFPYFASSLFINGHFGHSGFVPYFASFPYFAVPYCERLLYINALAQRQ